MITRTPAYHLTDIRHYYGEKKVLDIPQLKIEPGSITGITGPNGSGKSTLLKLMGFIQKPSSGQILYNGRPELPFSPIIRSKVTLLTQKPYLLKRTVIENIIYGLKIRKDNKDIKKRVKETLRTVGLDNDSFAYRKWHELSGGEAQRVALAARLILKPDVMLLDEPIASVDMESAKLIREASLKARDKWGTTLVIVSHDLQWLYSISDRQLGIFKGNLFFNGMGNILTGPFEQQGDKTLVKKVGDGQQIILTRPSSQKRDTAIIRKKYIDIDIEKQTAHERLNQLSGHITSMLLEKKKGYIMTTILIHDLSFVLRLIPDQISNLNLYPGKKVFLKFQSHDVEWM